MRQLTTPTHTFKLFIPTSIIDKVKITYAQNNKPIVWKGNDDCEMGSNYIRTTLTQEDTQRFDSNYDVQVQLRVKTTDGKAIATKIYKLDCGRVLDSEVL